MDLRHLRTFVAVAEERRFRAAARRLHLSPPSVTEHIHALERHVGAQLLTRGRVVEVTAAGAELLPRARRLLADAADARRVARAAASADGVAIGELRVGVMSNGAGSLTAAAIRAFMDAHPAARVHVQRLDFTDHAVAILRQGVDVAFVRPAPDDARLVAMPLTPDARVLVVPQRHPVADATRLPVAEALELPFVGLAADVQASFSRYLYLDAAGDRGAARRGGDDCRDVTDVLAAVAAGRGVASAAESFRGYAGWPGVAYVPLEGIGPAVNSLVARRDDHRPAVAAFKRATAAVLAAGAGYQPPVPGLDARRRTGLARNSA